MAVLLDLKGVVPFTQESLVLVFDGEEDFGPGLDRVLMKKQTTEDNKFRSVFQSGPISLSLHVP